MTLKQRLTSGEQKRLAAFLASPQRPDNTLNYHELQGFLYAVVNAPAVIPPSEWLPAVYNGGEVVYEDRKEARAISECLMVLYNEASRLSKTGGLPSDCTVHKDPLDNIGPDAPLRQWANGFLIGDNWASELWDFDNLDEIQQRTLLGTTAILKLFADPDYLQENSSKIARDLPDEVFEELPAGFQQGMLQSAFIRESLKVLTGSLAAYSELGWSLSRGSAIAGSSPVVASPRVGRNAPCPCGSGKKFKKCCGG